MNQIHTAYHRKRDQCASNSVNARTEETSPAHARRRPETNVERTRKAGNSFTDQRRPKTKEQTDATEKRRLRHDTATVDSLEERA